MTLREFAEIAGVRLTRCDASWGGTWAYKTHDNPNCTNAGYRSEAEALKTWGEETFGKVAFKALRNLLEKKK